MNQSPGVSHCPMFSVFENHSVCDLIRTGKHNPSESKITSENDAAGLWEILRLGPQMCSNLLARETQTILICEHRMITAEPFSLQQPAEFPSMQHFGSKHVPDRWNYSLIFSTFFCMWRSGVLHCSIERWVCSLQKFFKCALNFYISRSSCPVSFPKFLHFARKGFLFHNQVGDEPNNQMGAEPTVIDLTSWVAID